MANDKKPRWQQRVPHVVFNREEHFFTLFEAALWFVRKGTDGPLVEEFDAGTIDPLFRLFDTGVLHAEGTNRRGETEIITGVWQTASTGDFHKARWNAVYLSPDEAREGSTLTKHGDASPTWIHIRVPFAELSRLFPQISAPVSVAGAVQRVKGGPRTPEEITAEKLCAEWLVANYMGREGQKLLSKAQLRPEAQTQPGWGSLLRGKNAFDRAWAMAVASGQFEAWAEGGATRRG